MSFFNDGEIESLKIKRMIFHVVGKTLPGPILLSEISPPLHTDFFLGRVKSALVGNLFEFRNTSNTERILRLISHDGLTFASNSQLLAADFQTRHSGNTSMGVFFLFELSYNDNDILYALIKYDNEDVVRYVVGEGALPIPSLERFQESFVRKAEAMQKIALVRLTNQQGGEIIVRDRSNTAHISDYFEGFLDARRINTTADMSMKLVDAFKQTFKKHKDILPPEVQKSGVNRIYSAMRQDNFVFGPENCDAMLAAIFGNVPEGSPLRKTLQRELKERGVADETFTVDRSQIPKPKRHVMETVEGVQIRYDDGRRPAIRQLPDGRKEISIVTTRVTRDDVEA
jgi:37-kD nucleoid-associated bacterial protein